MDHIELVVFLPDLMWRMTGLVWVDGQQLMMAMPLKISA